MQNLTRQLLVATGQRSNVEELELPASLMRYTFTPAGDTEEVFQAFFDAAQKGELGPEQMTEIAARFDQEFVGPTL